MAAVRGAVAARPRGLRSVVTVCGHGAAAMRRATWLPGPSSLLTSWPSGRRGAPAAPLHRVSGRLWDTVQLPAAAPTVSVCGPQRGASGLATTAPGSGAHGSASAAPASAAVPRRAAAVLWMSQRRLAFRLLEGTPGPGDWGATTVCNLGQGGAGVFLVCAAVCLVTPRWCGRPWLAWALANVAMVTLLAALARCDTNITMVVGLMASVSFTPLQRCG
jgi:hypothetical protein